MSTNDKVVEQLISQAMAGGAQPARQPQIVFNVRDCIDLCNGGVITKRQLLQVLLIRVNIQDVLQQNLELLDQEAGDRPPPTTEVPSRFEIVKP